MPKQLAYLCDSLHREFPEVDCDDPVEDAVLTGMSLQLEIA
jgi:hypothetical protein